MTSAEIAAMTCDVLFIVKDETINFNIDHAYLIKKDDYANFITNNGPFIRNGGFEHTDDSIYWDVAGWEAWDQQGEDFDYSGNSK